MPYKNIRTIRKLHGFSQKEMSNIIGIHRITYVDLELGNITTHDTYLERISILFDVPCEILIKDKLPKNIFSKILDKIIEMKKKDFLYLLEKTDGYDGKLEITFKMKF